MTRLAKPTLPVPLRRLLAGAGLLAGLATVLAGATGQGSQPLEARPAAGTSGAGYWLVAADGGVFSFGDAAFHGSTGGMVLNRPVVGMAATPTGGGYWLVASDGGVFTFGDAGYLGSTGDLVLNQPVVAMAPTPSGRGYWLAAADGGVFTFGDAGFHGSAAGLALGRPVVAVTASPTGRGYWLTAGDGTVMGFGDVAGTATAPGRALNQPVVASARTPSGTGHWLAAGDGGVITVGDAPFAGSAAGSPLNRPVVAVARTATGLGYWLAASDGGVFTFGDADFHGSTGNLALTRPVVGMATTARLGVGDVPAPQADSAATTEDTPVNIAVLANDGGLGDGGLTTAVASPPGAGAATVNADGSIRYTPGPDRNGVDTFTYRVTDRHGDTGLAVVTVSVAAVNDAPSFSLPASPDQTAMEDAGPQTAAGFATAISAGPPDEAAQALSFGLSTDNPGLFAAGPAIDAATGTLTWQSAPGAVGTATVTVVLTDGGGTAGGGVDTSPARSFTVTVESSNAAPVAGADSHTLSEDGPFTAAAPGVLANDTDTDGPPPVTALLVAGPAHASTFALGADGSFGYTPAADFNGTDSFTYRAVDGAGAQSGVTTVTLTVGAVNDAPVNTLPSSPTFAEDTVLTMAGAGALSVADVDAAAGGVRVTLTATNGVMTLDGTTGLAFSAGDGTGDATMTFGGTVAAVNAALDGMTFSPTANFAGAATVTVLTDDLGNTGAGGALSDTDVLSLTVSAVNDAPVATVPGAQVVDEDSALTLSSGNGNTLAVADVDAGSSPVRVTLTAQNGSLTLGGTAGLVFSAGDGTADATMTFDGTLGSVNTALNGTTFQPAANFNTTRGDALLALTVDDLGNTGTGVSQSDGPEVVAVTVNAVNDPPVAAAQAFAAQANMRVSIPASGLLAGASDPDTGDGGYTAALTVDTGSITATSPAGGGVSNVSAATGSFDFDPPPGATGGVTFGYRVCDTGNPGPAACSPVATATVTVAGPVIWFVNPAAVTNGDGRLSTPFNTLAGAAAVDAAGHRIFLHSGTATTGLTLNTNEWLVGQGVTGAGFDAVLGISPPPGTVARPSVGGTRPVVQGQVTMATGGAVRGLNVQPGAGTQGVTASGATGLVVGEVSVTTGGAAAVNLADSDGTFSFTAVSANGGTNGIVWTKATAAAGSFTVTGTGTAGSGGTVQSTTGDGISLSNARSVSFSRVIVQNNLGSGINGSNVTNFTLADSTVDNNGDDGAADEAGIRFTNLLGTASITGTTVANSIEDNARIVNNAGALTQLTVTGSTFRDTEAVSPGNNGLLLQAGTNAGDTGSITADLTGNSFLRNRANGLQVVTNGSGTVDVEVGTATAGSGGTFADNNIGVNIAHNSGGTLAFDVRNASFSAPTLTGAASPINLNLGGCATNLMSGTVTGNVITNNNSLTGPGIRVVSNGPVPPACPGPAGTMTLSISGNDISQVQAQGIQVLARDGASTINATILNNTVAVSGAGALDAIRVDSGATSTDDTHVCADIRGNTATTIAGQFGIRVRQRFTLTSFSLEGYGGSATDDAGVAAFLASNNTASPAPSADHGGAGFGTTGNCPEP